MRAATAFAVLAVGIGLLCGPAASQTLDAAAAARTAASALDAADPDAALAAARAASAFPGPEIRRDPVKAELVALWLYAADRTGAAPDTAAERRADALAALPAGSPGRAALELLALEADAERIDTEIDDLQTQRVLDGLGKAGDPDRTLPAELAARSRAQRQRLLTYAATAPAALAGEARLAAGLMAYFADDDEAAAALAAQVAGSAGSGAPRQRMLAVQAATLALQVAQDRERLEEVREAYRQGRDAGRAIGRASHPAVVALDVLAAEAFSALGAKPDTVEAVAAVRACLARKCRGPPLPGDDFTLAEDLVRIGDLDQARSLALEGLDLTAAAKGDVGEAALYLATQVLDDAPSLRRAVVEEVLFGPRARVDAKAAQRPKLIASLAEGYGEAQRAAVLSGKVTSRLDPAARQALTSALAAAGPPPDPARLALVRRETPGDHREVPPFEEAALTPASTPMLVALNRLTTNLAAAGKKAEAQAIYQAYVDATLADPARDHGEAGRVVSDYQDFLIEQGAREEASAQDVPRERERAREYADAARKALAKPGPPDSIAVTLALDHLAASGLRDESGELAALVAARLAQKEIDAGDFNVGQTVQAVVGGFYAAGRTREGTELADRTLARIKPGGLSGFGPDSLREIALRYKVADVAAAAAALATVRRNGGSDLLCGQLKAALPQTHDRSACLNANLAGAAPPRPAPASAPRAPAEPQTVESPALIAELEALDRATAAERAGRLPNALALAEFDLKRIALLRRLGRTPAAGSVAEALVKSLADAELRDSAQMTQALLALVDDAGPARTEGTERLLAEQLAGLPADAAASRAQAHALRARLWLTGAAIDLRKGLTETLAAFDTPDYWTAEAPPSLGSGALADAVLSRAVAVPGTQLLDLAPLADRLQAAAALRGGGDLRYQTTALAALIRRARGDDAAAEALVTRMLAEPLTDSTSMAQLSQEGLAREVDRLKAAQAAAGGAPQPAAGTANWVRTYRAAMDAGAFARAATLVRAEATDDGGAGIWTLNGSEPLIGAAVQFAADCRPLMPGLEGRLARAQTTCRREALGLLEAGLAKASARPWARSNHRLADVAAFVRALDGGVPEAQLANAFRLAAEAEIAHPTDARVAGRATLDLRLDPDAEPPAPAARAMSGGGAERPALVRLQRRLGADQALVILDLSGAMIIRGDGVTVAPLAADEEAVRGLMRRLRADLDPAGRSGDIGFDAAAAYQLWALLFAPLEDRLKGVRRLDVVPFGVLQQTPFEALLTAAPKQPRWSPRDPEEPAWAVRRFAFSLTPSLAQAARLAATPRSTAALALLGLGAPQLAGGGPTIRSVEGLLDASGGVDPRRVRGLTPLPAAQGELEAMRAAVGAAQARLMVDVELREDAVRALRWSDYRVVAFATHGFLAAGSAAPGQVLVLTPPGSRTPTDDGVLSSAEIRSFKFDADLVILSACDTGATTEAVGASFADAFLAAGARSVVVSRWPLLSDTAALLTLPLVREAAQRGSGRLADAERDAILALLRDPPRPELRHPMFWAAFTVVGDLAGGPS